MKRSLESLVFRNKLQVKTLHFPACIFGHVIHAASKHEDNAVVYKRLWGFVWTYIILSSGNRFRNGN